MVRIIKIEHDGIPKTAWHVAKRLVSNTDITVIICNNIDLYDDYNDVYVHDFRDFYQYYVGGCSCIMKVNKFDEGDVVIFKKYSDFRKWAKLNDELLIELEIKIK